MTQTIDHSLLLDVQVTDVAGRTVLTVRGEIDLATIDRLRAYLDGVIALDRGDVGVDLSGVSFMDSTGVGLLLRSSRALASKGWDLVICAQSPCVVRVLAVSGTGRHLTHED